MTRTQQRDIPANDLRTMNVRYRKVEQYALDPEVVGARNSYRASRPPTGTRTTGTPRYPLPDTNTGTQRNSPRQTGQQPRRTTGGEEKVYATSRKTEKLRRQSTKSFVLTIIGMTMLCVLVAAILIANVTAWWQNGQDSGYYTQIAHRDYVQLGNAQVWAFMAGNQIDVVILKSNDISHAKVLIVAEVMKDAGRRNLELVRSNDGTSVLLTASGEHVGGLTFAPSQDTHTWSIDVEKEAVK